MKKLVAGQQQAVVLNRFVFPRIAPVHPPPFADGAGFSRQRQVWNIVFSNANVLNFHIQSSFWLVLLLYRRRNLSSNVQSPRFCDRQNRGGMNSVRNIFDINKKSERTPDGE